MIHGSSPCSGQVGLGSGSGSGAGVLWTVIRENLDVRLSASSRGGGGCSSFLSSARHLFVVRNWMMAEIDDQTLDTREGLDWFQALVRLPYV
jgi:hypothetical protein